MKVASTALNSIVILIYIIVGFVFTELGYPIVWIFGCLGVLIDFISIIVIWTARDKSGGYIFQGILNIIAGCALAGIFMLCVPRDDLMR